MENKNNLEKKFVTFIFGPTASGKSDFAQDLAIAYSEFKNKGNSKLSECCKKNCDMQIINCDVGQFYTKLSIGTAKPDYKNSTIKHHLFDIIDKPIDFNVLQYRKLVFDSIDKIFKQGGMPVLVGGSGFYLKSMFFPPFEQEIEDLNSELTISKGGSENLQEKFIDHNENFLKNFPENLPENLQGKDSETLWEILNKIDPERASKISKQDIYRINRALLLWYSYGKKPSELLPVFDFPYDFLFIFLNRDRNVLYSRINDRTGKMFELGWVEEVEKLIFSDEFSNENLLLECKAWENFLIKKKFIGHDIIVKYLIDKIDNKIEFDKEVLIEKIKQITRNYAKRQITFWKSLKNSLQKEIDQNALKSEIVEICESDFLKGQAIDMILLKMLNKRS